MSEYGEGSPLCWKPARATFVIPPGRSDHEGIRAAGKAYVGPALTSYQRSTAAVNDYWQAARDSSLIVKGAQLAPRAAPKAVTKEAMQDHITLGTDNYYRSPRTKWDQYIGERPPRTRGIPGYTGCQPRPEQVRGTPDHTQRKVKASAPELALTNCHYIPAYQPLATASLAAQSTPAHLNSRTATGTEPVLATRSPTRSSQCVPGLDLTALHNSPSHVLSHAGKGPCLLAGQLTARPDLGISHGSFAGPGNCQPAEDRSPGAAAASLPKQATRSNGLYTGQAGLQPNFARCGQSTNMAASYHTSGAATWRGPALQPINIGSSRNRGNECYGGVRNSSNGLPPFALQTPYRRGW